MNELTNNIASMLPDNISDLSEQQLRDVFLHLKLDDYKAQMRSKINANNFNLSEVMDNWLIGKSEKSKKTYTYYVNNFISFLGEKSVLDVNIYTADVYKNTELIHYSFSKSKISIASISSFYSYLVRWEFVDRNPFKGMRVKNTEKEIDKILPTEKDIDVLIKSYNSYKMSDKKMKLAIYMMSKYGVRVGFFNGKIEFDGTYLRSFNKGKWYKVNIGEDKYIKCNIELLNKLNSNTIQNNMSGRIKKLYNEGAIVYLFSCHALRHFVACREYKKDKDIYRVSRLLNHSSISITEVYLSGLNIEMKGGENEK